MQSTRTESSRRLDLPAWLAANGIETRDGGTSEGWRHYHVDCLFDASHGGKDAYFGQHEETGAVCYHCSHHSCQGNRWAEARRLVTDQGGQSPLGFVTGDTRRSSGRQATDTPPWSLDAVAWDDLAIADLHERWLCRNILVAGQPAIVGGASKTLKTSITLDLVASLVTGSPFLGKFEIPEVTPTLMISAESGAYTIRETLVRILLAKQQQLVGHPLHLAFKCPSVAEPSHLDEIARTIRQNGAKVFVLDPAYLSLMNAKNAGDATNLFAVGALLRDLTAMVQDVGATLVLLHHFRKGTNRKNGEAVGLEDFSFSGFGEFARQWLAIQRLSDYVAGSGKHELRIGVGGSVGHSGDWQVDVDEGQFEDVLAQNREWVVNVQPYKPKTAEARHRDKLYQLLLKNPEGVSKNRMRQELGDIPSTKLDAIMGSFDGAIIQVGMKGPHPVYGLHQLGEFY